MGYTLALYALNFADLTSEPSEDGADWIARIEELGKPLATLEHASTSGAYFREELLPRLERLAGVPDAAANLLSRAIPGVVVPNDDDTDVWIGGIAAAELVTFHEPDEAVLDGLDSDDQGWIADLSRAFAYAKEHGVDIVTVYG